MITNYLEGRGVIQVPIYTPTYGSTYPYIGKLSQRSNFPIVRTSIDFITGNAASTGAYPTAYQTSCASPAGLHSQSLSLGGYPGANTSNIYGPFHNGGSVYVVRSSMTSKAASPTPTGQGLCVTHYIDAYIDTYKTAYPASKVAGSYMTRYQKIPTHINFNDVHGSAYIPASGTIVTSRFNVQWDISPTAVGSIFQCGRIVSNLWPTFMFRSGQTCPLGVFVQVAQTISLVSGGASNTSTLFALYYFDPERATAGLLFLDPGTSAVFSPSVLSVCGNYSGGDGGWSNFGKNSGFFGALCYQNGDPLPAPQTPFIIAAAGETVTVNGGGYQPGASNYGASSFGGGCQAQLPFNKSGATSIFCMSDQYDQSVTSVPYALTAFKLFNRVIAAADPTIDNVLKTMTSGNTAFTASGKGHCLHANRSGTYTDILLDIYGNWYATIEFVPQDAGARTLLASKANMSWSVDPAGTFYVYSQATPSFGYSWGWDLRLHPTYLTRTFPIFHNACIPCGATKTWS